jgi:hypothetical protein
MLDNKVDASHYSIKEIISAKLNYIYIKWGKPPWELSREPHPNFAYVQSEKLTK